MISVILPIYNVAEYLPKCMDSVFKQSYKNLEIILVDDGSTDDSKTLCDEYAKTDSRIKVIHKKNGGLSDARNVGMQAAKGDWIYFLDSDDWISETAIEQLITFSDKNNCDVVQGGLYYTYPDHLLKRVEEPSIVLDRDSAMKQLIINDRVKNFAWGKLYKASIIKDLPFPVGKYFEDSFWQHLVIDRVKNYGIIDTPLYYYRQRANSISGTISDKYNDLIEGYTERARFIQEKYPQYADLINKKLQEIKEVKYPKKGILTSIKRLYNRIKNRIFPSTRYQYIQLDKNEK